MGKKSKSKSNQKKRAATTPAVVKPTVAEPPVVIVPDAKENANPQPATVAAAPVLPVAAPLAPLARRQTSETSSLPAPLASIFTDLTPKQQVLVKLLCSLGQEHVFANWPVIDGDANQKLKCVQQLETLHESCGLMGYISNARKQQNKKSSSKSLANTITLEDTKTVGFVFSEGSKVSREGSSRSSGVLCNRLAFSIFAHSHALFHTHTIEWRRTILCQGSLENAAQV
jgi:hypothetical protein